MATITFPRPTGETTPAQAVYMRPAWADSWTQEDIHCTRLTLATGESLSTADFYYRFGQVIKSGGTSFSTYPVVTVNPLSYVRVVVSGSGGRAGFNWYGVWRSARKGEQVQTFSAVGLEALLDEPCQDSPYYDGSSVRWAGRALVFNSRGRPNRSTDKHTVNGVDAYTFHNERDGGEYWTTRDAVELLLALAAPKTASGTVIFNWTPSNLAALPDYDRLHHTNIHGASYLAALRAFVPRHRLVGWHCRPGTGDTVEIHFDTFTATDIDLLDTEEETVGTIPACTGQDTVNHAADTTAAASMTTEASNVADQVIVTGAKRKSVFSISGEDSTWTGFWTVGQETQYLAGASGAADYPPATEPRLREERDIAARAAVNLRNVFSKFGPADTWDQLAGDGEGNIDPLLPIAIDDAGDQVTLYPLDLRFADVLPLQTNYEYDGDKIADLEGEPGHHGTAVDDSHEPLPILGFVRIVEAVIDPENEDRWTPIDDVGAAAALEQFYSTNCRRWSAEITPLDDRLGVEIRVDGEAQHVLAADEFALRNDFIYGSVSWESSLIVTVCVEEPREAEVRYPADDDVTEYGELIRRIRIEAPQYELIYVVPNTVVGVDEETQALIRTNGGWLVDDRPELRLLAQRTYEWHRLPRYAVSLSTGWIDGAVQIGRYITSITDPSGTYPVNSVISEITLDFPVSQSVRHQRATMTIATAFAELDASSL